MNKYLLDFVAHYPYLVATISFVIGWLFMPVVIEIARKYNFVVSPNKRTSHNGDIPNVGGINIFVSYLITVFLFSYNVFYEVQYVLLGLFIILIVGFVDDLMDIKALWKLFGQLVAGVFIIVVAGIRITSLQGLFGITELSLFTSYLLSFFVFIVVVNAINLIDGIDGLASGLGIIYSLFFGFYFFLADKINLSLTSFALTGALIVFFMYNVFSDKRKIFMGDSGSLLLGYMFFMLIIQFVELNGSNEIPAPYHMNAALVVGFTVFIVPLFDTLRVMLTRMKKGYSPFKADKNHVHHLMLSLGLEHRQVTYILMTISTAFIIIAILARDMSNELLFLSVSILSILFTKILWILVNKKQNDVVETVVKNKNELNNIV